jgi:hypothetical protein
MKETENEDGSLTLTFFEEEDKDVIEALEIIAKANNVELDSQEFNDVFCKALMEAIEDGSMSIALEKFKTGEENE